MGVVALVVQVLGLPSDGGTLRCSLFSDAQTWLDGARAAAVARGAVHGGTGSCTFPDVPPGSYAVAILHDLNDNGEMDFRLGLPQEPWGVSRDAPIALGRPRFADAVFDHPSRVQIIHAR